MEDTRPLWTVWDISNHPNDQGRVYQATDALVAVCMARNDGLTPVRVEFYMCMHEQDVDASTCPYQPWS